MTAKGLWGEASAILHEAGVPEKTSYYREFTAPDEKAVLTVPMRIQQAWQVNDADQFADVFAENGSLLMRDTQLISREEIRRYMADGFAGPLKGAYVNGWPVALQILTPDSAMVITEGGIIMPGESEILPENFIRATWIVARRPGGLELMSHQSSPVKN